MTTIKITGLDETISKFKGMPPKLLKSLVKTIHAQHEEIMTLAKEKTPVDTGFLRASGHVNPPKVSEHSIESEGAFGAEYGVYVHENLDAVHPVGEAKFYEKAALEKTDAVKEAVTESVNEFIKGEAIR